MSVKSYIVYLAIYVFILFFMYPAFSLENEENLAMLPSVKSEKNSPVLSDSEMMYCISLYHKAEAEFKKLLEMNININDNESVKNVINQYDLHDVMVREFNQRCAGKHSFSHCEAIKKENIARGLPYQDCK